MSLNNLIGSMTITASIPGYRTFTVRRIDGLEVDKLLEYCFIENRGSSVTISYENIPSHRAVKRIRETARRIRSIIVRRQNGRCIVCKCKHRLTMHHVIPISAGGSNDPGNIEGVCLWCHRWLNEEGPKCLGFGRMENNSESYK
jgi:5-methylcytosine-specific restriction endonuclease McrA